MQERIAQIKARTRLEEVAARYLTLKKVGTSLKAHCPHHDDKTPSLDICTTRQTFKCFSCGVQGDVIDFVEMMEQVDTKKALSILTSSVKYTKPTTPKTSIKQVSQENKADSVVSDLHSPERIFKQMITYYQGQLHKTKPPTDYLKSRGLLIPELIEQFQIGFCSGGIKKLLPQDEGLFSTLQEKGLLNDNLNESFYTCITIPIFNESGDPVGLYGRSIHNITHRYMKGSHKGVINWQALKVYREILLAESIIDALSLYALGIKNVIPLYGTNGLSKAHIDLLAKYSPEKITLLLDNDDAGFKAEKELKESLKPLNIPLFAITLPSNVNGKPCKDANDYLCAGGDLQKIQMLLNNAVALHTPAEKKEGEKKGQLIKKSENEATYTSSIDNQIVYTLKGIKTISKSSIRLIVGVRYGSKYHTDRLDFYSFRARKSFSRHVESELGLPLKNIEKELVDILQQLEAQIEEQIQQATNPDTAVILSEGEEKDAIEFLKSPNLLDAVAGDLTRAGYAGEDKNKKLAYLIATSRKIDTPLSCMIRSQSGAGKSQLMDKVASFMPDEEILLFSRISHQSLYYMPKDGLSHKLLIIDERNGSEDADYSIRSLQSQKKLSQAVVMKDPSTGKQKTQMFEIYGPIAYMDSSTQMEVNPENENRCFVIFLGENKEQTNTVLSAQRHNRTVEGWQMNLEKEGLQHLHKNAQRMLRPLKVIIPFADSISFPDKWVRVRRDQERFLSLIEASAFLHQYQRPVKGCEFGEYIEATLEDYRIAYDLSKDILQSSLSDLSKMSSNLYDTIKKNIEAKAQEESEHFERIGFTQREVREWSSLSVMAVKRCMSELMQLEYVTGASGGRGSRYTYRLSSEVSMPELTGLMNPDELHKKWVSGSKVGQSVLPHFVG